jgi:metal-responsive CopG/Arc/MetJ family transcriptional regulator
MPKKILVALPEAMLEQVDFVAQSEHRTRSDLIRESLRCYLLAFRKTCVPTINQIKKVQPELLDYELNGVEA